MKGIVFTELLELVEQKFGSEMVDDILDSTDLPSGGAYTAVGTYNHEEILAIVSKLSYASSIDVTTLVQTFGRHLFGSFLTRYPEFFEGATSSFQFLQSVEGYIHVEVKKLYPDAELPSFSCRNLSSNEFEMVYRSRRPFGDLAEGLILACIDHFGESITLERINLTEEPGQTVRFLLTKKEG